MFKSIIVAYLLSSGADAATTTIALHRGGKEVLIPSQNVLVIDSVTAAQAIGVSGLLIRLHKNHPKLAMGLGVMSVAIRGTVVTSNINQLRKR